jgi:hypothetical protein
VQTNFDAVDEIVRHAAPATEGNPVLKILA